MNVDEKSPGRELPRGVIVASLTVVLAVRDAERAKSLAAILRGDEHTVILAYDATSAVNLTWQYKPNAILFDPQLSGANADLGRRLRRAGLGEKAAILALGDRTIELGPESEVDYQLPMSFDPLQLSGLIHYVLRLRHSAP